MVGDCVNVDPLHGTLDKYRIEQAPPSIYYIPDFITEAEEKLLLKKVNDAPLPRWTQLSNRRLQNWGGDPHPKGMIAEELPEWLTRYTTSIGNIEGLFVGKKPNHVLVNEYLPGQGIMPHLDGPLFHPTVTTISLGSHTVLNFYRPLDSFSGDPSPEMESSTLDLVSSWSSRLEFSLLVKPRSLLILREKVYDYYLHGIEEITKDTITDAVINTSVCSVQAGDEMERSTRVSLTIRHVPRTTKPMLKLFGKVKSQ